MIVAEAADGRLRLITQPDHAHLAAAILRLWRADGLPGHPRREELLFAVREHDNGWREADSAPLIDPRTGRPADFLIIPDALRREIWQRSVERPLAGHPYAGALIAEHALTLFARKQGGGWDELLSRIKKTKDAALLRSGLGQDELLRDYPWLRIADDISLWICTGQEALERPGRQGRCRGGAWELDPFPLAGATTFRVPCRYVPAGPYPSDVAFAVAAASARWEELAVGLRDPSSNPPW